MQSCIGTPVCKPCILAANYHESHYDAMNTIFNDHQIAAVYIAMITMNVFVNVMNMQEYSGLLYIIIMCSYAYTNYTINSNV